MTRHLRAILQAWNQKAGRTEDGVLELNNAAIARVESGARE
jgi:hypothetical protein